MKYHTRETVAPLCKFCCIVYEVCGMLVARISFLIYCFCAKNKSNSKTLKLGETVHFRFVVT